MVKEPVILTRPERFAEIRPICEEKLDNAIKAATEKLKGLALRYGKDKFPSTCSKDFLYPMGINRHWECGMYTGCYWLAYELTGDEFFREVAESHIESYRKRVDEKIGMDDHDVGFVFSPSCIAAYKLTGNEYARQAALDALEYFYKMSYSKEGKFIIRYHEGWAEGDGCRTMMDSLMNAPLLFWGAKQTGNQEYYQAGLDHTRTTEQLLIREDASSFHHYQFNPADASPVRGLTFQGYKDDSCWSRGHSWGVYGFPIAYSYTGEEFLKEVHKNITYFMLNHLPEDMVPCWDYDFIEDAPKDSSAAVISACGLLEMAKMLPEDSADKRIFLSAAYQMIESVIDNYTTDIGREYDGLIHHVTHAIPFDLGIDECAIYGDYFYLEALLRLKNPEWKMYW